MQHQHRVTRKLAIAVVMSLSVMACSFLFPQKPTPTIGPMPPIQVITDTPVSLPAATPIPAATDTQSPAPTPVAVVTAPPAQSDLEMVDAQTGWGITDQSVYRTTNGWKSWTDVTPRFANSLPVSGGQGFFLDVNQAWILYSTSDPNSGQLYHTTDGGQNWMFNGIPFPAARLQFLDAKNGWALVDRGAGAGSEAVDVYRTHDSGANWTQVFRMDPQNPNTPGALPFSGIKSGLTFADSERGWVTGNIPMENYPYLFATLDGGKTWQQQKLTVPAGYSQPMLMVEPPRFFDTKEGILPVWVLSGDLFGTEFYRTGDGGQTWILSTPVASRGPYSIATLQDFFVWDGGTFHASHDGGQTWKEITPNIDLSQIIGRLQFVDAQTGWATSMDAEGKFRLYQTRDGGATWSTLIQ